MANATKLPELDTFQDPAQLGHLQALRSTVLKSRRDYFPSPVDGNRWFSEADKKIEQLRRQQRQAPAAPAPVATRGAARGAEYSAHLTSRIVTPRTKKNDGGPTVKVMNAARSASSSHRPALVEEPARATVVGAQARPAMRAAAPSSSAVVVPSPGLHQSAPAPVSLLAAIEAKYRHAQMMMNVFQCLRQSAVEANHGNTERVESLIGQAEEIEADLRAELAHEGPLNVVRPPKPVPQLPEQSEAQDSP